MTQSWNCAGCTNVRYFYINGEIATYCRRYWDKTNKGNKWESNFLRCLDYTKDSRRTLKQAQMWQEPTTAVITRGT